MAGSMLPRAHTHVMSCWMMLVVAVQQAGAQGAAFGLICRSPLRHSLLPALLTRNNGWHSAPASLPAPPHGLCPSAAADVGGDPPGCCRPVLAGNPITSAATGLDRHHDPLGDRRMHEAVEARR